MTDDKTMQQRLREARTNRFTSAKSAAEAFGWTVATYTSHENGARGFGVDEAKRYGRAFGVNPGWLLALDKVQVPETELLSSVSPLTERLEVCGSVAAGIWREHVEWPRDERYEIEVGPTPFRGAQRFALRMDGYSMDRTIPPGSTLECVRVAHDLAEPQIGDLVIAERHRNGLVEMTCKRLDREGNAWVLLCESTKDEFRNLVIRVGTLEAGDVSDDETRIVGIVVNAYQKHFRRRF